MFRAIYDLSVVAPVHLQHLKALTKTPKTKKEKSNEICRNFQKTVLSILIYINLCLYLFPVCSSFSFFLSLLLSLPSFPHLHLLLLSLYSYSRPKFILVRIGPRTYSSDGSANSGESTVSAAYLQEDVRSAARYLRRKGFTVSEAKEGENLCGEEGKATAVAGGRYRCVWCTRLNDFEFSGKKWGVW
jgi:hypothetical protein